MTATHYCSVSDVFRAAGMPRSAIDDSDVLEFIKDAEAEVDRYTDTTYWAVHTTGTAISSTNTTLTDTNLTLGTAEHSGDYLWIYEGTGNGQMREISNNTPTVVTVDRAWTTNPDTTSYYRIIHTGTNPYKTDSETGDDTTTYYTLQYPVQLLESATINTTSINTSNIFLWGNSGKLKLNTTSNNNTTVWTSAYEQKNVIKYWYGVYPIPRLVKKYTAIIAAMQSLVNQIGGTFDDITSYSLPEFTASKGEPYTNIRETIMRLDNQRKSIERKLVTYARVW